MAEVSHEQNRMAGGQEFQPLWHTMRVQWILSYKESFQTTETKTSRLAGPVRCPHLPTCHHPLSLFSGPVLCWPESWVLCPLHPQASSLNSAWRSGCVCVCESPSFLTLGRDVLTQGGLGQVAYKTLTGCLPFQLTLSLPGGSWDHLPNKLLTGKPLEDSGSSPEGIKQKHITHLKW